jgi:signal recognition particle subunit SRP54
MISKVATGIESFDLLYGGIFENRPTLICGAKGTGKTTSVVKIANQITKKNNRNVLLVAADVIRPAAIEQLKTLGESVGIEVFSKGVETSALDTVKAAKVYAKENNYDTVLIDTAGRLHIDEELMHELEEIKLLVNPTDILLTVDAMTGQDIINIATKFNELLAVSGLVVTKMDGDSRGGSVLSVRSITQVPVMFVGTGEKIGDLEIFYPDRMADRILGMGDIVTLVETAQENIDEKEAEESAKKMLSGLFTIDDMLKQIEQVSKMGPLGGLMKMIPGMGDLAKDIDEDEAADNMKYTRAIIQSMTPQEKTDPSVINNRRKKRIASGSGTTVKQVSQLISQFDKMKKMMKQMGMLAKSGSMPNFGGMFGKK